MSEASERNANANGKATRAKNASVKANERSERTQCERKRKNNKSKKYERQAINCKPLARWVRLEI